MKRIALLAFAALVVGCASETVDDTEGSGAAQTAAPSQKCGADLAKLHDTPAKALQVPGSIHDESNHYLTGVYSLKPGQTGYLRARFDDPANFTAYRTRYSAFFDDGDSSHPGASGAPIFVEVSFACDNPGSFDLRCEESLTPKSEPGRCCNRGAVSIAPDCSGRNDGGYATFAVTRKGDLSEDNPCGNFNLKIMTTADGLLD